MDLLCKVCDRSIIENESEDKDYIAYLLKEKNEKYTIFNNINLGEIDKILTEYVTTYNKKLMPFLLFANLK